MKYGPVGFCVWCGKAEGDVPRLTDEHIVSEGLGGRDYLAKASCDACADRTKLFEQHFMRVMYPAARAYWNLYGKRSQRPKTLSVQYELGGPAEQLDVAEHPFSLFMPLLDAPRMLAGLPIDRDLPDLREPGRLWYWAAPDSADRVEAAKVNSGSGTVVVKQQIWLGDFYKTLAKFGHAYAVARLGYSAIRPGLLPGLVRAPSGAWTDGATSLVGGAFDANGRRVESIRDGSEPFALQLCACDADDGRARFVVVRIQMFAQVEAPVYDVVVAKQLAVRVPVDMTKRIKYGTIGW